MLLLKLNYWFDKFNLKSENIKDINIVTKDKLKLHGWMVQSSKNENENKNTKNNSPILLFFHGNAGNISHRMDNLNLLQY